VGAGGCDAPDHPTPSTASIVGASVKTPPLMGREHALGGPRLGLALLLHGGECAGEEDERVFDGGDPQVVDPPHDDPVIAGGMFGDDLALEGG